MGIFSKLKGLFKKDNEVVETTEVNIDTTEETIAQEQECKQELEQETIETVQTPDPISEEEFNRLSNMCSDIHKEYKNLMKEYKNADTDEKVYILKECYRKLEVIETTVRKHKCYYDIDVFDEYEKIEKKARSFINAYIKEQREDGYDDYLIDVTQFSFDLQFISDYIYEKDEKLNK